MAVAKGPLEEGREGGREGEREGGRGEGGREGGGRREGGRKGGRIVTSNAFIAHHSIHITVNSPKCTILSTVLVM